MKKQSIFRRTSKSWIIIGILSLFVLIGVVGCGASQTTSTQSTQGQNNQGQTTQGQRTPNPAIRVVSEIRRLQSDQQNALTSDQKDKIKPILQELISTTNPSQDFLQQKADAINAVFTDQQKSFLATRPNSQGNNSNGDKSNTNNPNKNNPNGNSQNSNSSNGNNQQGTGGNNQSGRTFNPQDIYQQVLDSLK